MAKKFTDAMKLLLASMGPGFISPEWMIRRMEQSGYLMASMGPGFISPECKAVIDRLDKLKPASMGPGFISPECAWMGGKPKISLKLQWGRASSARNGDDVCDRDCVSAWLQWGRASSARNVFDGRSHVGAYAGFNGAGLHQPGMWGHGVKDSLESLASMGPGFISPECRGERQNTTVLPWLQWGRASSARNVGVGR